MYVPWLSEWTAFQWDSEVCKEVVKVELDLNSWASCESSVDSAVAGKQLLKIPNQYEFHCLEQKKNIEQWLFEKVLSLIIIKVIN